MKSSRTIVLGGACIALALTPAAAVAAGPTTVSVRIEGKTRTLLPATNVRTRFGSITKGGAPAGACPATTAAGALDVATHHRWQSGAYGAYGLSVTSVLGESHPFTSTYYWSIFVNDRFASAGICGLKLHRGEQLLFAAVPDKGTEYPIVLSTPAHATSGQAFTVKATYFGAKGAKPLAGVSVKGGGVTNQQGMTTVTAATAGKLQLTASRTGYIRAEATVTVS